MELSKRLQAVAELVGCHDVVADVGTDHGYIPIYLLKQGKCKRAFAMDVNEGPLLRAKEHLDAYGLQNQVELRLSDGVKKLSIGECDCVVIAGMGGGLTIKILEEGKDIFQNLNEFVLQPQSEIGKVRKYLLESGYCIVDEDMIFEDGKFYPMMKVIKEESSPYQECELKYGKHLLVQRHPILKLFLEKEFHKKRKILDMLEQQQGSHIEERKIEIKKELEGIEYALQRYYEDN